MSFFMAWVAWSDARKYRPAGGTLATPDPPGLGLQA
jgi:hypothetical protein